MKTPEEIKKGLAICCGYEISCRECPYDCSPNSCDGSPEEDAIEYINQLESRLAQVERERDALVHFIQKESFPAVISNIPEACQWCKNLGDFTKEACKFCLAHEVFGNFEFRGVCPENSKEE